MRLNSKCADFVGWIQKLTTILRFALVIVKALSNGFTSNVSSSG